MKCLGRSRFQRQSCLVPAAQYCLACHASCLASQTDSPPHVHLDWVEGLPRSCQPAFQSKIWFGPNVVPTSQSGHPAQSCLMYPGVPQCTAQLW
uniref:Putative secreted protein n=1 Tax=Ixodes ricinus TaxID=34613 RepID=A0A6B0UHH6_IXORI